MIFVRFALLVVLPFSGAAAILVTFLVAPPAALIGGVILLLFSTVGWMLLLGKRHLQTLRQWAFVLVPVLFTVSAWTASLLMESAASRAALAALVGAALARYAWLVLMHFFFPRRYQPYSLAAFVQALAILTLFFIGFDMTSLSAFLALPPLPAAVGIFGSAAALVASSFVAQRIAVRGSLEVMLVVAALIAELFGVIVLLPVPPGSAGALLALSYYLLSGIVRLVFDQTYSRPLLFRYVFIAVSGAVLALGTARWV